MDSSPLAWAAAQNARLKTGLAWSFGGKAQRGWHLYLPLVCHLLDADGEAESGDFASALARWQASVGLAPSGILDHETWMRMVATFQAQRIKERATPPPDQLIQAPASDFYDPSRPDELRCVERRAYAAYRRMVAAAAADLAPGPAAKFDDRPAPSGVYLKIISAFRSPAYQAHLRQRSPHAGRAGLALNSPHFTGRALDLYVGGEPVSTDDRNRALQINTQVYQWLVKNAGRFGFHPYFYEPWHWEYRPQ